MLNRSSFLLVLSVSIVANILLATALYFKSDKTLSDQQLMSFCMKNKIQDKDCKIPYQYKRS